jgi:nitroimidazol reductase NimA-like FMN-containing flavoprotein (pyridoxamine 5'-phosphate oxidase superfamily)
MQDMMLHEIDAMLSDSLIGRLCMADAAGRPYTVPLPFCWADGAIYLRIPLSGRKGHVLAQNDQVCFEVDQFTDTLDAYGSVLVEGRLVAVTEVREKQRVRTFNDRKYDRLRRGHRPRHGRASRVEDLPMRKIVIEQISGRKKDSAPPRPSAVDAFPEPLPA